MEEMRQQMAQMQAAIDKLTGGKQPQKTAPA
jgi:hypothetical protein